MTDTIKMAEIERANIEFERQRHLANWLIKSSLHVTKPSQQQQFLTPPVSQQKLNVPLLTASNNKNSSISIKNGTVPQNAKFFGQKSSLRKGMFPSQTNLPLQILTQSSDGHKPKLRRFNSHDTSVNMFSVVDFENARLARRNEIEKHKYKMNSLSSGGDCSTGDSKRSKCSNDSNPEPLSANIFLERYSLPRVIRLQYADQFNTLISSSSNDSGLSSDHKKIDKNDELSGKLFFLYRHLKNRNIYHGYNTKNGSNRKKCVKIPQEYQGYFSLVNERGQPTATMYTTIIQLVRERVYKFVTIENMPTYTEQQNDTFPTKSSYVKDTAKAGQIFRLLAVFQDGGVNTSGTHHSHPDSSNSSLASQTEGAEIINTTGRDKERGRYAQLLGENRQIVYVSLSIKGKFYEIEQSATQVLQRSSSLDKLPIRKKINNECVHHIKSIVTPDTELPILLKFISGPSGCGNLIPENITIHQVSTENSLVMCPIEETDRRVQLSLRKIHVQPDMLLTKCCLGFENEQRMFANQKIQNILKFCQYNCDNFQRLIEIEHNCVNHIVHQHENGLKILRPLNFTKFLNRDKLGHKKEDSIIFLSKNDLDNLEIHQQQKQLRKEEENDLKILTKIDKDNQGNKSTMSDKMKVFQISSNKKKWFKNFNNKNWMTNSTRIPTNSYSDEFMNLEQKRCSMDRYQDISRLLQERFDSNIEFDSINCESIKDENNRSSSEMRINESEITNQTNLTKKSISLQDIFDRNLSVGHSNVIKKDQLREMSNLLKLERAISTSNTLDYKDRELLSNTNYQQSFISEKLYNEFYVKTKHHSKSSSNLQQRLHFVVPQKISINKIANKKFNKPKNVTIQSELSLNKPLQIEPSAVDEAPKITITEDDLPYSDVRDSLIFQQIVGNNANIENSQLKTASDFLNERLAEIQNENIYAEICNDTSLSTRSSNSIDETVSDHAATNANVITGDSSIRISISTSQLDFDYNVDNIYNTIK